MSGPRVVSLVPSITETLLAWRVVPVACTRFCEQPGIATVGGTKDPDLDAICALAPDLVVLCDEENRREDWDDLVARGVAVHSCSPRSVAEVAPALRTLADAVGVGAGASGGGSRIGLSPSIDPLEHLEPLGARAFVPIWRRPWMSIGADTYGSSVLVALGVDNVVATGPWRASRERYPVIELDEVRALEPDVVVAPSEPYAFRPAHLAELATVAPVVSVDGQDLFWWGVRTPAAVARLHAALRPHVRS